MASGIKDGRPWFSILFGFCFCVYGLRKLSLIVVHIIEAAALTR